MFVYLVMDSDNSGEAHKVSKVYKKLPLDDDLVGWMHILDTRAPNEEVEDGTRVLRVMSPEYLFFAVVSRYFLTTVSLLSYCVLSAQVAQGHMTQQQVLECLAMMQASSSPPFTDQSRFLPGGAVPLRLSTIHSKLVLAMNFGSKCNIDNSSNNCCCSSSSSLAENRSRCDACDELNLATATGVSCPPSVSHLFVVSAKSSVTST